MLRNIIYHLLELIMLFRPRNEQGQGLVEVFEFDEQGVQVDR